MKFDFLKNSFSETNIGPDKIAISGNDVDITWEELKNKLDELKSLFLQLNIPKGHPIIIYGHKEHFFPLSILCCIYSEITYIPIDVVYPAERIEKIIMQTGSQIVINCTNKPLLFKVPVTINSQMQITQFSPLIFENNIYCIENEILQYIMFTSGSTGEPKGVQITKNNILSFVEWALNDFGFNQNDVFLNQAPFSFDVSLCDIINAFAVGGTIILVSNELIKNQNSFLEKIKKYNCSVWTSTPSFAYLFLRHPFFEAAFLPSLKKFLFMGEELPNLTCKKIKTIFPESNIYNAYGPTEATIVTTLVEITDEIINKNKTLPIGYCKPNAELFIEKANANEENGELIICGDHVSYGYFKNDKLNNEKFFTNNGKRCFKTGDLAFQKNNLFYFLGRNDEQIKLHGYRIELNEINHVILSFSSIQDAVTLPLKRNAEVKKIISFIILNENATEKEVIKHLNEELSKKLPYYMVPSEFIVVKEFPYTSSHKIDKNKLIESYLISNN